MLGGGIRFPKDMGIRKSSDVEAIDTKNPALHVNFGLQTDTKLQSNPCSTRRGDLILRKQI